MSVNKCRFCETSFNKQYNLERHFKEERCKKLKTMTQFEIYQMCNNWEAKMKINGSNNNVLINSQQNVFNIKVEIQVNPINKLDLNCIDLDKMKDLIIDYDDDKTKLKLLLSDYVKDVICNKEHPENHAVKYIRKNPPTYNILLEDKDGRIVSVIKGLRDTCDVLTDPVLDALKSKLKECLTKVKTQEEFDYELYKQAIKDLKKELNKSNVKRALSSVLQNNILHDIQMKLNVSETPNTGVYS